MTCTQAYASYEDFAAFWCIEIKDSEESHINRILEMASTPIHAARAASGGCDCTLASWVTDYLIQLTCILAATTFNCKCSNLRLEPEDKRIYLEFAQNDLMLIRTGQTELCAGETGSDFAVTGWAEQGVTEFARARIIAKDVLRNLG
jgi:hypothetical protein